MKYGYVRVSTKEQNLDRQLDALEPYGCDIIYQEKASGKDIKGRPEFQTLLGVVKEGDEIYVSELSRFARSVADLSKIVDDLNAKGVRLVSIKEGFDLTTSTGRMMCNIIGAVAQFERENIRERQQQGIEAALARGKTWGKPAKYDAHSAKMETIFGNFYSKVLTSEEAIEASGMPTQTFYYWYRKWRKGKGLEGDLRLKENK